MVQPLSPPPPQSTLASYIAIQHTAAALTYWLASYIVIYMPSVALYIREDDYNQWKSIEKKSEFVHDSLIMARLPQEVINPPQPKRPIVKKPDTSHPRQLSSDNPSVINMTFDRSKVAKTAADVKKQLEPIVNIRQNSDGSVSPIDPGKPSSFTTGIRKPDHPKPTRVVIDPEFRQSTGDDTHYENLGLWKTG